jgi:hypothetical protein
MNPMLAGICRPLLIFGPVIYIATLTYAFTNNRRIKVWRAAWNDDYSIVPPPQPTEAPSSNTMPRLLHAFAFLFIHFPGVVIWLYGAALCVAASCPFFPPMYPSLPWSDLLTLAAGATAIVIGYLMIIVSRILCNDPIERFAGIHFAERVLWKLAIQFSGILTVAAAMTTFIYIFTSDWKRVPVPLCLLFLLATASVLLGQHWTRLRNTWLREIVDARAARARLDFHPPRRDNR